jgi:hypothetical protein
MYLLHSNGHLVTQTSLFLRVSPSRVLKKVSRENINAREVTSHGIAAGLHLDDVPLASRRRQILSLLLS